jgi:SAM-dependent methyltransferase
MNAHFVTRPACPGCDSRAVQLVFSRAYDEPRLRTALCRFYADVGELDYDALLGAGYVVQKCTACGLHFQRDVPDDFLLARLYEEWISPERAYARFHSHVSPAREREIAREVSLSLSLTRAAGDPPRVLDYGCGWGEWLRAAKTLGAETWGTELSPSRRAACERFGIRVVSQDALPERAFDVINADQVFEHLPSPAATLSLLERKLRRGGVLRIAVPNGCRIEGKLRMFEREIQLPRLGGLNPIAPLEHLNCFTTRSLGLMAANSGLVRLKPTWTRLARAFVWPPGFRAKLKQLLLPVYLKSRWSTELWFTHADFAVT